MASANSATHTLKLTAVTKNSVGFTSTTNGLQETDVSVGTGKTIGFDDVYITFTGNNSATANVAFDIKGGFLYGTVITTNAGKTFSGKVTGGTGAFKGATGTITAWALTSNKTAVTITYSYLTAALPEAGRPRCAGRPARCQSRSAVKRTRYPPSLLREQCASSSPNRCRAPSHLELRDEPATAG